MILSYYDNINNFLFLLGWPLAKGKRCFSSKWLISAFAWQERQWLSSNYHQLFQACKARGVLEWSISACMASSNCTGYCLDSYQPPVVKVSSGFVFYLGTGRAAVGQGFLFLAVLARWSTIHECHQCGTFSDKIWFLLLCTSLFLAVQTYIWYIFHSSS